MNAAPAPQPARHAVLLAAGRGARLAGAAGGLPKCLLELGGRSLLARHLTALEQVGVRQLTIGVGFRREAIEAALEAGNSDLAVTLVENERFERGSVVTLWTLRDALARGEDVLLMDADVLCDQRLLARLQTSAHSSCILIDRDFEPGDEPVKACVRGGRPVELRKRPDPALGPFDLVGESVGFFRCTADVAKLLVAAAERYVRGERLDQPHEEALRDVLLAAPEAFGYEDITGLPWVEIDFPADVTRARAAILPRLQ